MSQSNYKSDNCFMQQQNSANKSVFDYVIDNSMYKNTQECNNFKPPFIAYVPSGIPSKNVDIENDLKGIVRPLTKCNACKFTPDPSQPSHFNSKPECHQ